MINRFISLRHFIRNKKAFTLVELLVAMGIAGILITTIYGIYSFGMKVSHRGFTETQLQMETRVFLQHFCDDLQYAKEIEEFNNNRIKFKKFYKKENSNENSYGDNALQDITYEITRENGKSVIKRYIDIEGNIILVADEIDDNVFTGYMEKEIIKQKAGKKIKKRVFEVFDTFIGDSEDRKKITLISINLNIKKKKESLQVVTKVALPYIHKKMLEPYWNGGSND